MLKGKKILLGISGSIAAYKSILLVRLLVKSGAEVRVILTPAATRFVSPLVLGTLSKNKVLIELFEEDQWANHVMLGRWADVFLMAPLSCNTLAKMVHGQCDNLLLAVYLSATCPIMLSPAMDEDMWHHSSTCENIEKLKARGHLVIPVEHGELASGLVGEGRMAEPETIIRYLEENIFREKALKGKKIMISAGPTYEPLDPVRFIGNHSSGKMGIALAEALYLQGAEVHLILGPASLTPAYGGIHVKRVKTAAQMFEACTSLHPIMDIEIMSAAVADYSPVETKAEKIKKSQDHLEITLTKTKDILGWLGTNKKHQYLIGFALETHDEKKYAKGKLEAKNADMIVLNSLRDKDAGFGYDTNKVTVFTRQGEEIDMALTSKKELAFQLTQLIIEQVYA
jgi:phosphopantothenoylcysteine decarboxylase/phosphopantothenate--cysteine ligase